MAPPGVGGFSVCKDTGYRPGVNTLRWAGLRGWVTRRSQDKSEAFRKKRTELEGQGVMMPRNSRTPLEKRSKGTAS